MNEDIFKKNFNWSEAIGLPTKDEDDFLNILAKKKVKLRGLMNIRKQTVQILSSVKSHLLWVTLYVQCIKLKTIIRTLLIQIITKHARGTELNQI